MFIWVILVVLVMLMVILFGVSLLRSVNNLGSDCNDGEQDFDDCEQNYGYKGWRGWWW